MNGPSRPAALVEVVEEQVDSRAGVTAEDLLYQVRVALAERRQQVAVVLDPAQAASGCSSRDSTDRARRSWPMMDRLRIMLRRAGLPLRRASYAEHEFPARR